MISGIDSAELARSALIAVDGPLRSTVRDEAIDYIDIAPRKIEIQIPLVETFERIRKLKADAWQIDFCQRLQDAFANRHEKATSAMIHAEPQLGKSTILANIYPAWILGHDPMHRIALATYNVSRSQAHSKAVISIMQLPVYKEIFNNTEGHVPDRTGVERWKTNARRISTDPQDSFNPVGLQSGLTGSGFDTLIIDDPYADQKEAFSETTRKNLQDFWEYTVTGRRGEYSNIFGMFHRYHVEDLAGYLLDKGTFDYWRYATIADGNYIHESTGQVFPDPLGREIGELISERRSKTYYADKRQNNRVWMSLHQGRPSTEEGEFFNVGRLQRLNPAEAEEFRNQCSILVRGWDLAATEDGGDYSVGFQLGMRSDRKAAILDIRRKQVDTAGRDALQLETATADGANTVVTVPNDPGAGGKSTVYYVQRNLAAFTVIPRPTSGSKEDRARPLASAINSGDVFIATDDHLPEDERWVKHLLTEFRNFPLSDHDDIVDAGADAFNEAFERITRGLVIKNFRPHLSLLTWPQFSMRFKNGKPADRIPKNWTVYAAVKITADASMPNAAVIAARAPMNSRLDDTIFVVAEYKELTDDPNAAFEWLDAALNAYFEANTVATIWLHENSAGYRQTLWQKLQRPVAVFEGPASAGIAELDWYCLSRKDIPSAFEDQLDSVGLYALIADPSQIAVARDEYGLVSMRQEFATWNLNEKGEPNGIGAVLDCLRMITYCFRTSATPLNRTEQIEEALSPALRTDSIQQVEDLNLKTQLLQRRMIEVKKVEKTIDAPVRGPGTGRWRRR